MTATNIKNLPEGNYVTEIGYSQSYPWQVVKETAKTKTIVRVKTKTDPDWKPEMHPGGFAAHCSNQSQQTWLYDGLSQETKTIRLNKKGKWVHKGVHFVLDRATYFYDYNF